MDSLRTTALRAGQSQRRYLQQGSVLTCMRGTLRLEIPVICIEGQTICERLALHEQQTYRVEKAGWITFSALGGDAEVLCVDAPQTEGVLAYAAACLGRWRRAVLDRDSKARA